jgi:hypothetical protein
MSKKLTPPTNEDCQVVGVALLLHVLCPDNAITSHAITAAREIGRRHMQNAADQLQSQIGTAIDRATGSKPRELKINPQTGAYE